jgi:hypothetical protein
MDIFNNKYFQEILLNLEYLEHGIKVKNNKIITYKYNFGTYIKHFNKNYIYNLLKFLKYNEEQINDIITYIESIKNPFIMFGVENNNYEVYVQTTLQMKPYIEEGQSWDNNIKYYYKTISYENAINILKNNIEYDLFDNIQLFLKDNQSVLCKYDNTNIFNLYIIQKQKNKVIDIKNNIISVLKYINNDIKTIENYLNKYLTWYLFWFRISKNINNEYEITFYFRKKFH